MCSQTTPYFSGIGLGAKRLLLILALVIGAGHSLQAAGLLIADGGFGGQLEIVDQDVRVVINNGIAVTQVDQVFRNTEDRIVEALYIFPVPKGASVANFSMWIEGREMIGEVVEKERARQIYNSYKQQRRDPGLLEQNDYKKFEMRIFPIQARAEQRIQIAYYQELDVDHDWATYVYPLATAPVEGMRARTEGRFSLNMEVKSEIPVAAVESPSHGGEFVTVNHTAHYFQASLEAREWDLNRDVVVSFQLKRPRTGIDLIGSVPKGEDGYLLLTLTPGAELAEPSAGGMDYVFVLDISGSMREDGKLGISRQSIAAFTDALSAEDRFEVMTFNIAATTAFNQLRSADDAAKGQARDFLNRTEARGGTSLRPALETAYGFKDPDRHLNVVILSDGMTQQEERRQLLDRIAAAPKGSRVFCIGVGNEVNRPLLSRMAEDAGGLAAFISRGDNFQRQAQAFRRKLLRPAASNVSIEFLSGGVYDVEPRKLPNLFHGSPLRLYARYKQPGPTQLRLRADIDGKPFEQVMEVVLPGREADNPEIERMWAWHRVRRLDAEADGNRSATDEIVRLGEGFSIVTRFTSFLVLENDAEYQRWKIERRNVLRLGRDRRKQERLSAQLDALRQNTPADLGPVKETQSVAHNTPVSTPGMANPSVTNPAPADAQNRGWDVDMSGGGAVDPWMLLLGAGAAVFAWTSRRRQA